MKIDKWKVFQAIQLLLFIGVSIFLLVRSVDGSGTTNTWNVKLVSFAVWSVHVVNEENPKELASIISEYWK